jgi:hypothetical protein
MMEFIRTHLVLVREKGYEWQLNVAWKTVALVAALTLAAHLMAQKSLDKKGLSQLASKGSVGMSKEKARRVAGREQ